MAERQFYARIRGGADTATAHDGEIGAVLELVTVARPGYLPLVTVGAGKPTEVPAGKRIVRTFRRTETAIERAYALDDAPLKPPRRFDPYRLQEALIREGVWSRVRAWLQADPDNWDRWLKAPDIDEDEPLFAAAVEAAKAGFGWTDEKIEGILSEALA